MLTVFGVKRYYPRSQLITDQSEDRKTVRAHPRLFLVRAVCAYLPSFLCVRRTYPHAMCINHQPSLTITTSYPSNNLSLLRLLSRVTGWLLLTLILITTTASSLDYFYFYLPPKQHYFCFRSESFFWSRWCRVISTSLNHRNNLCGKQSSTTQVSISSANSWVFHNLRALGSTSLVLIFVLQFFASQLRNHLCPCQGELHNLILPPLSGWYIDIVCVRLHRFQNRSD